MWGTILQVAYMIEFSNELKQFILRAVKPSLVSNNEDGTNQYYLSDLIDAINDEIGIVTTDNDVLIIQEMQNQEINYFEF